MEFNTLLLTCFWAHLVLKRLKSHLSYWTLPPFFGLHILHKQVSCFSYSNPILESNKNHWGGSRLALPSFGCAGIPVCNKRHKRNTCRQGKAKRVMSLLVKERWFSHCWWKGSCINSWGKSIKLYTNDDLFNACTKLDALMNLWNVLYFLSSGERLPYVSRFFQRREHQYLQSQEAPRTSYKWGEMGPL